MRIQIAPLWAGCVYMFYPKEACFIISYTWWNLEKFRILIMLLNLCKPWQMDRVVWLRSKKKKKNRMGYFALAKVYSWKELGSFSLSSRSGVVLHSQMPSLEEKVGKRERERWMKCTKKTVSIFVEIQNCALDLTLMFCLASDRHKVHCLKIHLKE